MAGTPRMRRPRTLHGLNVALLRTLGTQFILGMILNLYVTIPFPSPLDTAAILGLAVLVAHIVVGIMAFGISIGMLAVVLRTPGRKGLALTLVVFFSLLAAITEGVSFTTMYQTALDSFIMALGFYVALMASLFLLGRPVSSPSEAGTPPQAGPGA